MSLKFNKNIFKENKQRHRFCNGTILSYVAFSEDISDDSNSDLTQVQKYMRSTYKSELCVSYFKSNKKLSIFMVVVVVAERLF